MIFLIHLMDPSSDIFAMLKCIDMSHLHVFAALFKRASKFFPKRKWEYQRKLKEAENWV